MFNTTSEGGWSSTKVSFAAHDGPRAHPIASKPVSVDEIPGQCEAAPLKSCILFHVSAYSGLGSITASCQNIDNHFPGLCPIPFLPSTYLTALPSPMTDDGARKNGGENSSLIPRQR
jgi:hypothetical protein